ncbi:GLPGLI family protein [uncultured Tenacibaculum sp.]|uniref:GLPGLI family protein n=1 Tax=uncultured Tenacibaculum sp. TaxID=174713 RepID=UPI002615A64A|nr:GLPGLI family protein [uncultured Tenacibaculum sp.]
MKIQFLFLAILCSLTTIAQDFQGKATYKTHNNIDLKISTGDKAPNSDLQKQLQEKMKKMFQKTYTLNFTKSTSTYTQNKELEPAAQSGGVQIMMFGNGGGNDILYKNTAEKKYVNKTEVFSKEFLIKDKLSDEVWEMSGETKKIGNYTCYKATRTREEEQISHIMTDGETEEKKQMVTVNTVAWYTPEIPVSNGPDMFWGLPGLILEVHEGKRTIVCSEIVLNPTEKVKIKEPRGGKKVNQEEYEKIVKEKVAEMNERFKNNRGNGESINIQIGG